LAISKQRKVELVEQYDKLIADSRAIILTEYTGMSVKSMEELRQKVYEANGAFHVTKNTLLKLALENSEKSIPEDLLQGQLATGFAFEEAPSLAKALVDYAKEDEKITLRGGFLGNEYLTVDEIEALAKLPSLEQLRGQIVGLISAPAQNIVSTLTNGVRQVVNVVDAYAKKEETAEAA